MKARRVPPASKAGQHKGGKVTGGASRQPSATTQGGAGSAANVAPSKSTSTPTGGKK
jgi:hypothetical protein